MYNPNCHQHYMSYRWSHSLNMLNRRLESRRNYHCKNKHQGRIKYHLKRYCNKMCNPKCHQQYMSYSWNDNLYSLLTMSHLQTSRLDMNKLLATVRGHRASMQDSYYCSCHRNSYKFDDNLYKHFPTRSIHRCKRRYQNCSLMS